MLNLQTHEEDPEMMSDIQNLSVSEDFLSFSPSIVNILCYVDHKDILNCKIVNRRINQVIRRNEKYMSRIEAQLDMDFFLCHKYGNMVRIKVVTGKGLNEKTWLCTLTERKRIDIEKDSENHTISRLLAKCEMKSDRQYGNLLCELKTVMGIIFRRYNFAEMSIDNYGVYFKAQEEYCSVVCELFRNFGSKCTQLFVRNKWRLLKKLQTHLDVSTLDFWFTEDACEELISLLNKQNLLISLFPCISTDVKFRMMHAVIKKWERGECCFNVLDFNCAAHYQSVEPEICGYLKSQKWFDMKSVVLDDDHVITFRRERDARTLKIMVNLDIGAVSTEYYCFHVI